MTTKTYGYTGARFGFTVPIGVTSLTVEACGGAGGIGYDGGFQPDYYTGDIAKATFAVTPGQSCYGRVGGNGGNSANGNNQPLGGFNGGGNGSAGPGWQFKNNTGSGPATLITHDGYSGAAGGGCSEFRLTNDALANEVVVAAGGPGANGTFNNAGFSRAGYSGGDGTQTAGGGGGTVPANNTYTPAHSGYAGSRNNGGDGGNQAGGSGAPGGSAGYYGGGGAASFAGQGGNGTGSPVPDFGSGGRGSSYTSTSGTNRSTNQRYQPVTVSSLTASRETGYIALTYSLPPGAPAPAYPFNNSNVDNTQAIPLQWTNPPTPESGDSISGYQIQYRNVGDSDWTVLATANSTATEYDAAVGTFNPNTKIEWQVRSKGTLTTNYGPWSASSYFTAINPPPAPTIQNPVANQSVTSSPLAVNWAAVDGQQAYEVTLTSATNNGGTNYDDTGTVNAGNSNDSVDVNTITATEYVNVRVMVNGLWSQWSSVAVAINIQPPTPPIIAAITNADGMSITVAIANPGTGISVDHNDIYRSSSLDKEARVATGIAPNGTWIDYTPASNVVYTYRAVAVAANGAAVSS